MEIKLLDVYLGNASWLFTGALFNGYNPPDGYCFDIFCEDDPINVIFYVKL